MSAPSPSVSKITVKSQKPKEVKARRARLLNNPDCVALIKEAVAAANGGGECADCKERAAELIVELRENAQRRQPASSQGISRAAELKPPSHALSGAVPGTHPAACKRPQNRPRRGAAEPQNPAPRPNRPPGKKAHASPDRGGRGASNEPL